MTAAATPTLSRNQTRERFREDHRVRLIASAEEGRGFTKVPPGVYGFTYAPATETPLFSRGGLGAYEVHKLADGRGRMIVYCTPEQASTLAAGADSLTLDVFPEPYGNATQIVALPLEWISNSAYKVVRRDGNPVTLRVSAL
jgi:hypothetical protein